MPRPVAVHEIRGPPDLQGVSLSVPQMRMPGSGISCRVPGELRALVN